MTMAKHLRRLLVGLVLMAGASVWATPSPGLLYINGNNLNQTTAQTVGTVNVGFVGGASVSIPGDTVVVFAT